MTSFDDEQLLMETQRLAALATFLSVSQLVGVYAALAMKGAEGADALIHRAQVELYALAQELFPEGEPR